MLSFNDKTYCKSPNCINECGRQMSEHEKAILKEEALNGFAWPVCYGYFCGFPDGWKLEVDED